MSFTVRYKSGQWVSSLQVTNGLSKIRWTRRPDKAVSFPDRAPAIGLMRYINSIEPWLGHRVEEDVKLGVKKKRKVKP
jgi:hypothetical protein